ncbi:MAG: hypothetical protein TREMPRED_005683 [Tremellales sp. Tagirdzhanova-0007]|nr:MAG: hypothetical protein TREMPRED_005683 [Tremellales sp. Tagirdzhanova-0007]
MFNQVFNRRSEAESNLQDLVSEYLQYREAGADEEMLDRDAPAGEEEEAASITSLSDSQS